MARSMWHLDGRNHRDPTRPLEDPTTTYRQSQVDQDHWIMQTIRRTVSCCVMPVDLLLLVAMSLPFLAFGAVSAGVGATSAYAMWLGRRDPLDPVQARACEGRRAGLVRRALWVAIEGFWQTIAFLLQGVHLVRRRLPPPSPRCPDATPVILLAGYLENS